MVAACPSCEARYRVDVARLPAEGAKLRCSRCAHVFRVRPPAAAASPVPAAEPAREPAPQRSAEPGPAPVAAGTSAPTRASQPSGDAPEATPPPSPQQRERLVLVAHPEVEEAKRIADALASWGLDVRLAHDGVEAILSIQRCLPRLVVLDAALPKMFGFQVCELIKRNESLKEIVVVLVGAIHHESRYRRAPGELYGADAYLEGQELPEALAPLIRQLGLERLQATAAASPAAASPKQTPPAPRSAPAPEPAVAPRQPTAQPEAQAAERASSERATAERLARIIVSDIVLYNAERFEAAIRQGEVVEAMADELAEGRELLAQRVGDAGQIEGLLENEILRVARARGMR